MSIDFEEFILNSECILKENKINIPMDISTGYKTIVIPRLNFYKGIDSYYHDFRLQAETKNKSGAFISFDNITYTPMREKDNRYTQLERINFKNDSIWCTPTLSGCTVLFVEWFDRTCSMVHLRPQRGKIPSEFTQSAIRKISNG
ncbi:hypothetical protein [Piscirickettsia litoralis]|uniref:Uncharacterized protein n=1 Tax=Piscirickettsia litoralis TaxID=1891921 RepID=A0ABX3A572_9GAMM|nr:hypothetical protein [Piscirickettsia litoralis]ODN42580.1 hypothetical protein BGC07_06085 [Piscirickettsia litoralis]